MAVRLLVLSFFTLYQFGPGLASTSGLLAYHFLLLAPTSAYVVMRTVTSVRQGPPIPGWSSVAFPLLYAAVYSALYFPRANSGFALAANTPMLIVNVLFWHFAYSSEAYRNHRQRFFQDLWMSLALGLIAGFAVAQSYVGYSFSPGAVHNIAERAPLIRSDLDVPIFALFLGIVGIVHLWRRRRLLPSLRAVTWIRPHGLQYGAILFLMSLFTLFMYNRRTPLIAMMLVVGVLALPTKWGLRSLYGVFLFPLIPLFWDFAVRILIPLTQNDFVDSLLARNDPETYLTATNRLGVWMQSLAYLADFRVQHLWGYGGAPAVVLEGSKNWTHVHNSAMQTVFDAGFLTLALAVVLLVQVYRRLVVLVQHGTYRGEALSVFAVFVGWLVLSGVEPMMRSISSAHLFILALAVAVANLYRETTSSPLGSPVIALKVPRAPHHVLSPT